MKIYLDVCCLNRPFDAQDQLRVAEESMAVLRVLELIDSGSLTDYSSEMARIEIERMPDPVRRRRVLALLPPESRIVPLDDSLLDMAGRLRRTGVALADAVHVMAAAKIGVDVFLSVDDNLLKRLKRQARKLGVRVIDPVSFLKELEDGVDG